MTRTQRRAHAFSWAFLALFFSLSAMWALTLRSTRPIEPMPEVMRVERGLP